MLEKVLGFLFGKKEEEPSPVWTEGWTMAHGLRTLFLRSTFSTTTNVFMPQVLKGVLNSTVLKAKLELVFRYGMQPSPSEAAQHSQHSQEAWGVTSDPPAGDGMARLPPRWRPTLTTRRQAVLRKQRGTYLGTACTQESQSHAHRPGRHQRPWTGQ